MKVIYIAGPFRAENAWEIEQNIRRAETVALAVWRAGAVAICPHANSRFFQGAADDDVWLAGYLEVLKRCDAVLMLRGWLDSEGSYIERGVALAWDKNVFYQASRTAPCVPDLPYELIEFIKRGDTGRELVNSLFEERELDVLITKIQSLAVLAPAKK